MKKIKTIRGFTLILSIGTVISFLGRIPFRFIPLLVLAGNDYSIFSLTLQTFGLTISIAGLTLHSPLTREIRMNNSSKEIEINYAISYWITNFIGFFFFLIMGLFYLNVYSILQLLFFSLSIMLRSFVEFFQANLRAHGNAVRSALITLVPAIIEGLIIIPFIFNIQIFLNLNFFIYLNCFSLISSFTIGAILTNSSWKIIFFSLQKLRNKEFLMNAIKNIKKGFLLSVRGLFYSLGNWLVIFLAINIMTPNSFKIFDLTLFSVSFIALFSSNLLISGLSVSNVEDKPLKKKPLLYLIIFGIIMALLLFLIMDFISLEILLYEFFKLNLSTEGKNIIRVAILLIISMVIVAFLGGKVHALGRYKEIAISSFLSFLGLLLFLIVGFYFYNGIILVVGLLTFNLIEGILYYFYIYHPNYSIKFRF